MFNVRTQILCCSKLNLIFVKMLAKSFCKFFCFNQTLKFFVCFFSLNMFMLVENNRKTDWAKHEIKVLFYYYFLVVFDYFGFDKLLSSLMKIRLTLEKFDCIFFCVRLCSFVCKSFSPSRLSSHNFSISNLNVMHIPRVYVYCVWPGSSVNVALSFRSWYTKIVMNEWKTSIQFEQIKWKTLQLSIIRSKPLDAEHDLISFVAGGVLCLARI